MTPTPSSDKIEKAVDQQARQQKRRASEKVDYPIKEAGTADSIEKRVKK